VPRYLHTEPPNYQTISEALVMAFLLTEDVKYSKKVIALTAKFADDHYLKSTSPRFRKIQRPS